MSLLWEWQPTSRTIGDLYVPRPGSQAKDGPKNVPIPPKEKGKPNITKLVLSKNKEHVKTVQLIFDLFTRVGLTRNQITARLNSEGRRFYKSEFKFNLIGEILRNPAYVGDTHFGKTKSASNWSFDRDGMLEAIDESNGKVNRDVEDQLVRKDTHKGLIVRKVWNRAVEKMQDERTRTSFSPRNPAYYLKQIFVCGHCGKNMQGRTETDRATGKRTVVYMCSSYVAGKSNGQNVACGAYRITHEEAEKLLLDKIKELNLEYDKLTSEIARASMNEQITKLRREGTQQVGGWFDLLSEGAEALVEYPSRKTTT